VIGMARGHRGRSEIGDRRSELPRRHSGTELAPKGRPVGRGAALLWPGVSGGGSRAHRGGLLGPRARGTHRDHRSAARGPGARTRHRLGRSRRRRGPGTRHPAPPTGPTSRSRASAANKSFLCQARYGRYDAFFDGIGG
jgi:hypothetical protein